MNEQIAHIGAIATLLLAAYAFGWALGYVLRRTVSRRRAPAEQGTGQRISSPAADSAPASVAASAPVAVTAAVPVEIAATIPEPVRAGILAMVRASLPVNGDQRGDETRKGEDGRGRHEVGPRIPR